MAKPDPKSASDAKQATDPSAKSGKPAGKNSKKAKKAKHAGVLPAVEVAEMFDLDLKNRALAALLAWLWPGAGHLYQGRTAKGLLFMICIVSTFLFGFYVGGGKVAYATPLTMQQIANGGGTNYLRNRVTQAIDRWPFLCQAGIGAVAIPAVVERQRYLGGKENLWPGGLFYPPRQRAPEGGLFTTKDTSDNVVKHPNELAKWNHDLGFQFEVGTIYTVIAGLLNMIVIFDAYSGPLIPRPPEPKELEEGSKQGADDIV
ncbi:MAG: DUF6677 family protein [Planctomycetota bacterium]